LLVNGLGQLGEQSPLYAWFNMALAQNSNSTMDTTVSFTLPALDYYVGDAAATYDPSRGVTKFRRRMIYLRPDVLVVLDSIALSTSQLLELRFFPEQQTYTGSSGQYVTTGNTSKLAFTALSTSSSTVTPILVPMENESGGAISRLAYSLSPAGGSATSWENAVSLAWSSNTGTPKTVSMVTTDPSNWQFLVTGGTSPEMIIINKATEGVTLVVGVPPVPVGLTALSGNTQITLNWTASSSATSYTVERSTVSGGPYTTVASGIPMTSYVDTGLTNGTTYYYVVTATNQVGTSAVSAQASAVAQLTASEPFNYSTGALSSSDNGGSGFGAGWAPGGTSGGRSYTITADTFAVPANYGISVSDGKDLAVTSVGTSSAGADRNFANTIDTNVPATYYFSALVKLAAGSSTGDSQIRFIDSGGNDVAGFGGSTANGKLRINSAYGGLGTVTGTTAGAFAAGTQYLLVGKMQLYSSGTKDVFSFSLYPSTSSVPTTEPSTWGLTASADLSNIITGFQVYTGANTGTWTADNLELGATYTSVITGH
jgi:hypothetical protein